MTISADSNEQQAQTAYAALRQRHPLHPQQPLKAAAVRTSEDIASISEMLVERVIAAGRYAKEHGEFINSVSASFAKELRERRQAYASELMAAETKKQEELKRLLGAQT